MTRVGTAVCSVLLLQLLLGVDAQTYPGFERQEGRRCRGGSSIGGIRPGQQECIDLCLADPSCKGVNIGGDNCIARRDCDIVDAEFAIFYFRRVNSVALPPAPSPDYRAPEPDYRAPAPDYRAPEPDYRAPAPDYRAPEPDYRAPAPDYRAPEPDYRAPAPDYRAPEPDYRAPEPDYRAPEPAPAPYPDYQYPPAPSPTRGPVEPVYPTYPPPAPVPIFVPETYPPQAPVEKFPPNRDMRPWSGDLKTLFLSLAFGGWTGYRETAEKRCVGGERLGSLTYDLAHCKAICDADRKCVGINYVAARHICVSRSEGCGLIPDKHSTFYQKGFGAWVQPARFVEFFRTSPVVRETTTPYYPPETRRTTQYFPPETRRTTQYFPPETRRTTQYFPPETRRTTEYFPPQAEFVRGFDAFVQTNCVNGAIETPVRYNLEECRQDCENLFYCIGFTYDERQRSCVAVSGCFEEGASGYIYYRRVNTPAPTAAPTPIRRTTFIPPPAPVPVAPTFLSGYNFRAGYNCEGGSVLSARSFAVQECSRSCEIQPDCAGIIYSIDDGSCVAISGCRETFDSAYNYFTRIVRVEATTQYVPPAPAPAPVGLSGSYQRIVGKRCTGGRRVGRLAQSTRDCEDFCNADPDCTGYNYSPGNQNCVARANCNQRDDQYGEFFLKVVGSFPVAAPVAREPYSIRTGRRCTGGEVVGGVRQDINQCIVDCMQSPSCSGINYNPRTGSCVGRDYGCRQIDDSNTEFYEKN